MWSVHRYASACMAREHLEESVAGKRKNETLISDADLLRLRAARHRHAEEVLGRVMRNEPLMAQVRAALEEEQQGIPPVPWEQVKAEARARRAKR